MYPSYREEYALSLGGHIVSIRFQATIYQFGMNARVDVPQEISHAFNDKGYVSVRGTLNGRGVRGTFVPVTGGRHVLYVNQQMCDRAGVGVGDTVAFILDRDLHQRKPIPTELADALQTDPMAKQAWESVTPTRRKQLVAYLSWFSTPKTRARKVGKILRDLRRSQPSR
jgi:hypothetical protein